VFRQSCPKIHGRPALGILVFYDRGVEGVERLLVARHAKEFYTKDWDQDEGDPVGGARAIVRARDPKRIGINQAVKILMATADGRPQAEARDGARPSTPRASPLPRTGGRDAGTAPARELSATRASCDHARDGARGFSSAVITPD